MRQMRSTIVLLVALSLAGCKVGPNFVAPHEPVPDNYPQTPHASAAQPPASFWWQEFHEAELDRLEDQAAAGNLDLKAAYLRIV
jgi:outer membrane protein, multidrug efflux system